MLIDILWGPLYETILFGEQKKKLLNNIF